MSEQTLYMADIIMPVAPQLTNSITTYVLPLMAILLLTGATVFIWRYWSAPQRQILRQLNKNKIDARQAAHALAKTTRNLQSKAALDRLRFSRTPPSRSQIMHCLKSRGSPDAA